MEQEEKQINPAMAYKEASIGYCTRMKEYVAGIEAKLNEVSEHMDMNDPYHADALRSFTWGLMDEVTREIQKIGKDYSAGVSAIRDGVVNQ